MNVDSIQYDTRHIIYSIDYLIAYVLILTYYIHAVYTVAVSMTFASDSKSYPRSRGRRIFVLEYGMDV